MPFTYFSTCHYLLGLFHDKTLEMDFAEGLQNLVNFKYIEL